MIANTWHLYRCDGCGKEEKLEHGPWAEAARPRGWLQTFGWGQDACSKDCKDKVQAEHEARTGKVFIWLEWEEVPPPPHEAELRARVEAERRERRAELARAEAANTEMATTAKGPKQARRGSVEAELRAELETLRTEVRLLAQAKAGAP
jgi:hypothetical protein